MSFPRHGRAVVFLRPGLPFEEVEYPVVPPGPGEILVRNRLATVCGSDLHTVKGRRSFATPSILGHEIVGQVAALGAGVCSDTAGVSLSVGTRVVWSVAASCGRCFFCSVADLPQKCLSLFKYGHGSCEAPPHFNGGFAEYTLLRRGTAVFAVPTTMDDREAAPIGCAAATIVAGFDALDRRTPDHVVIIGAGMLGTYAAMAATDAHAGSIAAVDPHAGRLDSVRRFGADHVYSWDPTCADATARELVSDTGGFGADVVVEASGDPAMVSWAVELLRPGGQLLLLGSVFPQSTFRVDAYDLIRKSITIIASHNYRPDHLLRAIRFVDRCRERYPVIDVASVVGDLSPATVREALDVLERGESLRPAVRIPAIVAPSRSAG